MAFAMHRTPFDLRKALVLSAVVHGLFLFIHFAKPKIPMPYHAPLEVILVNSRSDKTPDAPKALAQVALDGGGNVDKGRATTLPTEAQDKISQRQLDAARDRLSRLESAQKNQLQAIGLSANPVAESIQSYVERAQANDGKSDAGKDLKTQRELEVQRLKAQIAQEVKEYNERPRKFFFSPSTAPYAFAVYEEAWRMHVEQVGNENYPEELRGKIYGKLRMTVYIRANGKLDSVEIDHSSGSAVLDRAAMKIVRQAGPFPTFPAEMRKQADILAITRTWVFSRDRVSTEF